MEPERVVIRLYADLVDLVGDEEVAVPVGAKRSVKDLIESIGVPHPEVALILVDGVPVDFDHLVHGGERVAVYPPFRRLDLDGVTTVVPPPAEPRFVADVHLGTLARRLRLLGFDTWYRSDADDEQLADVSAEEARILLTRDRGLLMRRVITHGYCPRSDDPQLQALEVIHRYELATKVSPFSRCINCNGELEPVDKEEVVDQLPPATRKEHDRFTRCRQCGQVYWPGTHKDALRDVVADLRTAGDASPPRTL